MDLEPNDTVVDMSSPSDSATNPVLNPAQVDQRQDEVAAKPDEVVEDKPKEPDVPKGVQKRIDRAVRAKYEAEARAKVLEERLAALEQRQYAQPTQQSSIKDSEPTIDKFDSFDEYVAAKAAYIAKQQIESTLTEREKRESAAREATERQKTVESWEKRVAQATAEMPDFEDVIASSEVPMTGPMQQVIMESDIGPKLAYHLANNPDEATKIAQMSPIRAIAALGRLEERLVSEKPGVKSTSTPPPIQTVGNRAGVKKDPGKMSDAEYAKWRKSAQA